MPIELPTTWTIPQGYSLRDTQAVLLSEDHSSVAGCLSFPILQGLPGTDYNALVFSDMRPNFSVHRYNTDGIWLTKQQWQEQVNEENSDMYKDEGSANEHDGVAPSGKITEDIQLSGEPTLALLKSLRLALPVPPVSRQEPALQLDTAGSLAPPGLISNPASASASAPTSAVDRVKMWTSLLVPTPR